MNQMYAILLNISYQGKNMLNTLSLIFVLILSLFLPFYCIDFHKDTILSIVNVEENSNGEQVQTIEHASTEKRVQYVEELAKDSEKNATVEKVEVLPKTETVPLKEEANIMVDKIEPTEEEPVLKETVLESSKNHALNDLEKLILDELNNAKKD